MLQLFILFNITIIVALMLKVKGSDTYVIKRLNIIGRAMCEKICEETASCVSVDFDRNELECDILGSTENDTVMDRNISIQIKTKCENHKCPLFHTCINLFIGRAYCIKTGCAQPLNPPNAVVLSGFNEIGSRREVECLNGYAMIGSQTSIVCHMDILWTTWPSSCLTCSEPSPIANGVVSAGSVTVGSTRTYSCNNGHIDNGQSRIITCGNAAQWSSTSFSCIRDCGTPPSAPRMTISYSSTTLDSAANYACEYGTTSNGGTGSSKCSSSGAWTSITLNCTRQSSATFDFEGNDLYEFDQTGAEYSWTRGTNATGTPNTGPYSAASGRYYMYFETSPPTVQGSKAAMQTRMWFSNLARCVDFYYNVYGDDIGTLSVKYMYEGSSSKYLRWSHTRNTGKTSWYNAKVPMNLSQDFKLIFEATDGGPGESGDIAVDYIRVYASIC